MENLERMPRPKRFILYPSTGMYSDGEHMVISRWTDSDVNVELLLFLVQLQFSTRQTDILYSTPGV